MKIELSESKKRKQKIDRSYWLEYGFFIALNLILVPFSAYQTFRGYEEVTGHWILTGALATVSGILFLAMNFGIEQRRRKGKPHLWQTLAYIIPISISFFGNFNAFYGQMSRDTLISEEIGLKSDTLDMTYQNAVQALNEYSGIKEIEDYVESELGNLKDEYDGTSGEPGWAGKCDIVWNRLVSYIEDSLGSNETVQDLHTYNYYTAENVIRNKLDIIRNSRLRDIMPHKAYIDSIYYPVSDSVQFSLNNKKYEPSIVRTIVKSNNLIGARISSIPGMTFSYRLMKDSRMHEIGSIKHTLDSAFRKRNRPMITAFSFFLSVIIDLAALIYILLFVPYNKLAKGKGNFGVKTI